MASPLNQRQFFLLWTGIAAGLVAADQWIKLQIIKNLYYGETIPLTPFFNLIRIHNKGAAFSMLSDAGGWQQWLFSGIALLVAIFLIYMLWQHSQKRLSSFAMSCMLGGAIGNLIDRVLLGYVVDYLDFHWGHLHFPAFNLADAAICTGVALLILNEIIQLFQQRKKDQQPS